MSRIVQIGGGVVGLCTALLLARDGHDVAVLERDALAPTDPGTAWDAWQRRGVNQFRLLHYFLPRFREVMEANLPDVISTMEDAGALRFNPLEAMPAEFSGGVGPDDTRYTSVTARRPVAEAAIAQLVAATPEITMRRGAAVTSLLARDNGSEVPHVVGVRLENGDEVRGDVVIDAGGRRSALPSLLDAIGARQVVEEKADSGFVYYGRHFRSGDGSVPALFGPLLMQYGSISILTLPADNGTWGVGIITGARDSQLRAARDAGVWERVVKSYPLAAHWVDGEPLEDTPVVMASIEDRHRTFVVDGVPVATGVLAVGDAWSCTNPSVGRGISIGAIHAVALRDLLADGPQDPVELACRWHDATQRSAEPWFRGTLAYDEGRLAEIDALLDGRDFQPDLEYEMVQALQNAAGKDPQMLRRTLALAGALDLPEEIFSQPGVAEQTMALGGDWRSNGLPGPDRDGLVQVVQA